MQLPHIDDSSPSSLSTVYGKAHQTLALMMQKIDDNLMVTRAIPDQTAVMNAMSEGFVNGLQPAAMGQAGYAMDQMLVSLSPQLMCNAYFARDAIGLAVEALRGLQADIPESLIKSYNSLSLVLAQIAVVL